MIRISNLLIDLKNQNLIMKKHLLILLIFFTIFGNAQKMLSLDDDQIYIDSIVKFTSNTKSDSSKCIHSFRLSKLYLMVQNVEKSKFYLDQGNKLYKNNQFLKDISSYYNNTNFLLKGDLVGFEKSLLVTNELLKKYKYKEAYKLRAVVLQNYAIMLQQKNDEKQAMKILVNEAIELGKKSEEKEVLSALYKAIGTIFINNNERIKAKYYFGEAQKLIEATTKKSATLIEAKVDTYIFNAENLIVLKDFDAGKKAIDKAYAILKKYPNSNMNNTYYFVEGVYYSKQNLDKIALQSYEKGIKSCEFHQDKLTLNRLLFVKYESLSKLKKYNEAKDILENVLANDQFVVNKKNYSLELSKTYKELGNLEKAYEYSQKYIVLNDSLNDSKFKNEIVALEAKFNKTENEKKINQLLAQKEKSKLLEKNNRLYMLLFGLAIAFLVISILFLLNYNKNQKKINLQNEQNLKQEFATLESNQKLAVSDALIEGEEIERKRLARDLHDGLGGMLSGLKIHINKLSGENSKNVTIEKIEIQLDNSIKELRQIAQNLMPESLLKLGLEAALRDLCIKLSDKKTAIEFQFFTNSNQIFESKQIIIYRIIQELLNNVFKHAKATEILVSCNFSEPIFYLTFEDNGKGFDTKKINIFEGMGLKNIKNRVEFLKGKLEIDSIIDQGTVFNIEFNLNE